MTRRIVAVLALTIGSLGCSPSEPPQPAPTAAAAKSAAPAPPPAPPVKAVQPQNPMPTISVPPPAHPPDPRRTETPCDRQEPGWKWQGNLVEDGRCVVGPCTCVKE